MVRFNKIEDYPNELKGRFNSFITTQFDDSLSVEMQLRSIIKWLIDNFKEMDQSYNDFTEYILNENINPFIEMLNDFIEYMNEFTDTFDERYQETILNEMQKWYDDGTLETIISESLDTKYHEMDERLTTQLAQKADKSQIGAPTTEQVNDWLDNNPQATTTVANGAVSTVKLSEEAVSPEKTTFIKKSSNLFDASTVVLGTINSVTGLITPSGNQTSDFIPILPNREYVVSTMSRKAFYDENRNFISTDTLTGSFITPNNAYYMRIQNSPSADLNIIQVNKGSVLLPYEKYYLELQKNVVVEIPEDSVETESIINKAVTPEKTSYLIPSTNLFNKHSVTQGNIMTDGSIGSANGYVHSDYIPVKPLTQYQTTVVQSFATYDANKNFIVREEGSTVGNVSITTKKDIRFIRLNLNTLAGNVDLDTAQVNEGPTLLEYEEFGYEYSDDFVLKGMDEASGDESIDAKNKDQFVINTRNDEYYTQDNLVDGTYISLTDVYAKYDALMSEQPDYISKSKIGDSYSGLPIYRYDFKVPHVAGMDGTVTPKMVLVSGTHGAERVAVSTLIHTMQEITKNWRDSSALETLKWEVDFVIIPIINPDGWESYGGSLSGEGNPRYNLNDVDINRNWGPDWSSNLVNPGTHPFSEPESQALKTVLDTEDNIIYFCDFHNFSARTNPEQYNEYIWNVAGTKFNANLSKTLVRNVSKELKKRFDWVPQDNTMFGITGWTPAGTIASYAASIGIQSSTFEVSARLVYAMLEGHETNEDRVISKKLAVETFVNWLVLNLKNNVLI